VHRDEDLVDAPGQRREKPHSSSSPYVFPRPGTMFASPARTDRLARLGQRVGECGCAQELLVGDEAARHVDVADETDVGDANRLADAALAAAAHASVRSSRIRSARARRIAFAWPVSAERKRPWSTSVIKRPTSALQSRGRRSHRAERCHPAPASRCRSAQTGTSWGTRRRGRPL